MSAAQSLTPDAIGPMRLHSQGVTSRDAADSSPLDVVRRLGALQGQDYAGALWSIGLRSPGATEADVEAAFERRELVRTWPMRGTLHVIPAADARWMLELLTPRVLASTATRRANLALDEDVLERAASVFATALRGGNRLTREEMMAQLEGAGISTAGQRGYHILFHLSMRRLIVFGPRAGTQQTFVLFDEWLPDAVSLEPADALARFTETYFAGHGPASVKDFAGWSGLTMADVRRGLAACQATLTAETIDGTEYWMSRETAASSAPASTNGVFLLPGFDEFLLGYKERGAVLAAEHGARIIPGGNGVFKPTVISRGRVAGIWARSARKGVLRLEVAPLHRFTAAEKRGIAEEAERYRAFLSADRVEVTIAG